MKLTKLIFASLAAAAMTNPAFAAGEEAQKQKAQQQEANQPKPQKMEEAKQAFKSRQVEGVVIQHKTVSVYQSEKQKQQAQRATEKDKAQKQQAQTAKNVVVLLKTAKGNERLIVDLGSAQELPEIKNNETKVQAEGRLVKLGQKEFFVARKVKIGDKTYTPKRDHQQIKAE